MPELSPELRELREEFRKRLSSGGTVDAEEIKRLVTLACLDLVGSGRPTARLQAIRVLLELNTLDEPKSPLDEAAEREQKLRAAYEGLGIPYPRD